MKLDGSILRKTLFFIVAGAVLAGLVYLVIYLTDAGEVDIPLEEGKVFRYEGEYVSRGSQKSITMRAHPHKIVVERGFEDEGKNQFLVVFYSGDHRWHAFILMPGDDGLYMRMGKKLTMVLPRHVKRGMKWEFNHGNEVIRAQAGGVRTFDTPMGKIRAREIMYHLERRSRAAIWVNKDVGVVALYYSYLSEGASRSEANLQLVSTETLVED